MENYHIIKVRHHYKPDGSTMVKLRSDLHRQTICIPYTHKSDEMSDPKVEAIKWLEKHGHPVIGMGEVTGHFILIVNAVENSFKKLK